MNKKIVTVVGARPQFIKASVVGRAFREIGGLDEFVIHTGQHYDPEMSNIFFEQLGIRRPDAVFHLHNRSHGHMTGQMLAAIEDVLLAQKPDILMVFGDTDSTVAGALAAVKLHIPVAHVEAGLRSYDKRMPEEINRVLTDHMSARLFCPTDEAVLNLEKEGIVPACDVEICQVGDVMEDAFQIFSQSAKMPAELGQVSDGFVLATIHRAENTDDPQVLGEIVAGLNVLHQHHRVIMPLHPRCRNALQRYGLELDVDVIAPVGYLEMLWLLRECNLVVTDSGGVQKEAYFSGKQCVTVRSTTEWVELVSIDANILVGHDHARLVEAALSRWAKPVRKQADLYGDGRASLAIARDLARVD